MSTIDELRERKSVRRFLDQPVPPEVRDTIIDCAINAPTAGNQMLYTILDITDPAVKQALAHTCDDQWFIADAPLVLVFLADCRRWKDAYDLAGCQSRDPEVGDWLLACQDAVIAAQNAVVAAHALGLGSCYIGDMMENRQQVVELLSLDKWVFPATLLVFGYPTSQQIARPKPKRFEAKYVVMTDRYRRLTPEELRQMYTDRSGNFEPFVQAFCKRKYMSDFAAEMNRSVAGYLAAFR
ncbi:MAG: nitroreductase family protein [Propionibacteriaceae bacterium]|nr:nitroreductase family protein [Propionibacteriaceae bacterium]